MRAAEKVFEIVKAMAEIGNPNSVSDAGVGALAARSAVLGARLNVRINAAGLKDKEIAGRLIAEADQIAERSTAAEREVLAIVEEKIG
jgi:glutamate formiminotransferase/formiminotetrahydrofolate cyclodeaminase